MVHRTAVVSWRAWLVVVRNFGSSATLVRVMRWVTFLRLAVLAGAAVWIGLFAATGNAVARSHKHAAPKPLVLHLKFHRSASRYDSLSSDGRYVFILTTRSARTPTGPSGTVIDERTGKRTPVVAPSDCPSYSEPFLQGPWLVFDCHPPTQVELYRISDGTWRTVTLPPGGEVLGCGSRLGCEATPCSPGGFDCDVVSDAFGAAWIRWSWSCGHCDGTVFTFQNIQTGELRRDPRTQSTLADLDSPQLARAVCSPLRVPKSGASFGRLVPDGSFALAQGVQPVSWVYLERCGTHLHVRLAMGDLGTITISPSIFATPHVVLWQTGLRQLSGLFLPSLRRFVLSIPASLSVKTARAPDFFFGFRFALSSRALYLSGNELLTATMPQRPPAR